MKKTAIILFADLPDVEARIKRFCNDTSIKSSSLISASLTQHAYELIQRTGAENFLIDTRQQRGKSFGERIMNAFSFVYEQGFENVICIGNDCPELDLSHLQIAITQTELGKVVLGPTTDGGVYLIGI